MSSKVEFKLLQSFKLKVYPSILPKDVKSTDMEPHCTTKTKETQTTESASSKSTRDGSCKPGREVGLENKDFASGGTIAADSVRISDENLTQAGGEIYMAADGSLSLEDDGTVFTKYNLEEGKYFTLRSAQNTDLYLALSDTSQFSVKGLKKHEMRNESDSYWRYLVFNEIGGNCPHNCTDIVLQYYGDRFGDPNSAPYYIVIEMTSTTRVPIFKIANRCTAIYCGRLGFVPP